MPGVRSASLSRQISIDPAAQRHRIPAPVLQLRERRSTSFQRIAGALAAELVVAQRRIHPQILIAPGLSFQLVLVVVGGEGSPIGHVAGQDQRIGMNLGDLRHQRPPRSGSAAV